MASRALETLTAHGHLYRDLRYLQFLRSRKEWMTNKYKALNVKNEIYLSFMNLMNYYDMDRSILLI